MPTELHFGEYDQQRTKCPLGAQAGSLRTVAAAGDRGYSIAPRIITSALLITGPIEDRLEMRLVLAAMLLSMVR